MPDTSNARGGLGRRRWLVLGVIGLAQLMVVLDLTVMNIALPTIQRRSEERRVGKECSS